MQRSLKLESVKRRQMTAPVILESLAAVVLAVAIAVPAVATVAIAAAISTLKA